MNNTLSKEEVLEKETDGIFDAHEGGITGIFNAMERFAGQESRREAIEILEWVAEKGYHWNWYYKLWTLGCPSEEKIVKLIGKTHEGLYDLYLLHKQNKDQ